MDLTVLKRSKEYIIDKGYGFHTLLSLIFKENIKKIIDLYIFLVYIYFIYLKRYNCITSMFSYTDKLRRNFL